MCTTIFFLGWAPGSRVPSQFPTIGVVSAAIVRAGTSPNSRIKANPKQSANSPNEDARGFFMVDLPLLKDYESLLLFRNAQPRVRALQSVFGARVVSLGIVAFQKRFRPVFALLRACYIDFPRTLRRFRQDRHLFRQHFRSSPRY